MFGFKKKLTRLGALVGASAAVMAVSGIGASGASAAAACPGGEAFGRGASLQKIAQEYWTERQAVSPFNSINLIEGSYRDECGAPTPPKAATAVKYESTGSGPGLIAWGFTGSGTVDATYTYIGTDDAPTFAQMANAVSAANGISVAEAEAKITGKVDTGADVLVIPVAQTAISVPVNLPANCELSSISPSDLEDVFATTKTTWSEVGGTGGGCSATIKRVVRNEGSGTTYQFKHYLHEAGGEATLTCSNVSEQSWEALQAVGAEEKPNKTWPCEAGEEGKQPVIRGAGGGNVVKGVANNDSSIGYASLPDAKATSNELVLKGGSILGVGGVSPEGANKSANCEEAEYGEAPEGKNADWSSVYPVPGGGSYPICTLTYDLAWDSYDAVVAAEPYVLTDALATEDFLSGWGVVSPVGQTLLKDAEAYYSTLPTVGEVQERAVEVAALIAF